MSNFSRDLTILLNIAGYCKKIEATINRIEANYDKYMENYEVKDSIAMEILQIGELANHLSDEFKEKNQKEINWNEIRGMRNRFVHGYGEMDNGKIFDTAVNDIPVLFKFVSKEIEKFKE